MPVDGQLGFLPDLQRGDVRLADLRLGFKLSWVVKRRQRGAAAHRAAEADLPVADDGSLGQPEEERGVDDAGGTEVLGVLPVLQCRLHAGVERTVDAARVVAARLERLLQRLDVGHLGARAQAGREVLVERRAADEGVQPGAGDGEQRLQRGRRLAGGEGDAA